MNALRKIEQAKYHLDLMKAPIVTSDSFLFNLVSFVSSGQEVTWYLQKEFAHVPEFKDWYKEKRCQMQANETMRFFHKKRVIVVHQTFPEVKGRTTGYLKFYYINGEGKVAVGECTAAPSLRPANFIVPGGVVTIAHDQVTVKTRPDTILQGVEYGTTLFFEERPDKPILALCEEYLSELVSLCEEWRSLQGSRETTTA